MKFRHNKKRNTFFIFEALIREMTKSTVAKNEEGKNKILLLIKEFFNKKTILAKSRLVLENQVAELLMENKANKEINFPKIDNLAFKTFLQKYNSTYSKNLLSEQKELLGKYITSFADNGLPFKIFLNEEIDRLKTNLTEKIKQTPQNNLNEQLKEVLTVVDGFKKQKIDKKLVEKVLKIQNLMGEI